jgi:topoisomerase-4 subunit A
VNREEGFIGLNWRQHQYLQDCTILDSVLCIMGDGSMKVSKVGDKVFMGLNIIHCVVFPKDGDTSFYSMIYQDGASGKAFAKRFQIGGVTRDKLYPLTKSDGSKVVYFEVSPTQKAMPRTVHVSLDGRSNARVREFDFDMAAVGVSSRSAKGLTVTKWSVKDVKRVDPS